MKTFSKSLLTTLILSGLWHSAQASTKKALIWTDTKGVESTKACRLSPQEQIDLRIAGEADLAKSRRDSVRLKGRSLVKALRSNPQSTLIQVIALAQNIGNQSGAGRAQVLDKGLVLTQKLRSL